MLFTIIHLKWPIIIVIFIIGQECSKFYDVVYLCVT